MLNKLPDTVVQHTLAYTSIRLVMHLLLCLGSRSRSFFVGPECSYCLTAALQEAVQFKSFLYKFYLCQVGIDVCVSKLKCCMMEDAHFKVK